MSLERDYISPFLTRHPDLSLLGQLVSAILLSVEGLEDDRVFARDFGQKPSTGEVTILVCDVHFKLDIFVNDDGNNLRVGCSDHRL